MSLFMSISSTLMAIRFVTNFFVWLYTKLWDSNYNSGYFSKNMPAIYACSTLTFITMMIKNKRIFVSKDFNKLIFLHMKVKALDRAIGHITQFVDLSKIDEDHVTLSGILNKGPHFSKIKSS